MSKGRTSHIVFMHLTTQRLVDSIPGHSIHVSSFYLQSVQAGSLSQLYAFEYHL